MISEVTFTQNQTESILGMFRYKTDSLERAIDDDSQEALVESAGIVRDLLLSDQGGLITALIKDHPGLRTKRKKRITFRVHHFGSSTLVSGAESFSRRDTCDHEVLEGVKDYTRDDFLRLPVVCIEGGHLTYKDIVSFTANKLGARHYDALTGTEKQDVMREIRSKFGTSSFDPILSVMRGNGTAVVATCREVLRRIEEID